MKYLVWLKKLPEGSTVWEHVKLMFRLLMVDLVKTLDRVMVAIEWGFGLTIGVCLAITFFNWLCPPI